MEFNLAFKGLILNSSYPLDCELKGSVCDKKSIEDFQLEEWQGQN
jgi:hypothetical protein